MDAPEIAVVTKIVVDEEPHYLIVHRQRDARQFAVTLVKNDDDDDTCRCGVYAEEDMRAFAAALRMTADEYAAHAEEVLCGRSAYEFSLVDDARLSWSRRERGLRFAYGGVLLGPSEGGGRRRLVDALLLANGSLETRLGEARAELAEWRSRVDGAAAACAEAARARREADGEMYAAIARTLEAKKRRIRLLEEFIRARQDIPTEKKKILLDECD